MSGTADPPNTPEKVKTDPVPPTSPKKNELLIQAQEKIDAAAKLGERRREEFNKKMRKPPALTEEQRERERRERND